MGISTVKTSKALLSMTMAYDSAHNGAIGAGGALTLADYTGVGRLMQIAFYSDQSIRELGIGITVDGGTEVEADLNADNLLQSNGFQATTTTDGSFDLNLEFNTLILVKIYNRTGGGAVVAGSSIYGYLSHETQRFIIPAGSPLPQRSYTHPFDVMAIMIQQKSGGEGCRLVHPTDQKIDLDIGKVLDFEFDTTLNSQVRKWKNSTYTGTKEIIIDGVYYNVSVNNGVIALTSIPCHVTNDEFWERFTTAEQEILIVHNNAKVKTLLYQIRIRPKINLRWQKLINTINSLESASIIGAGRADEIMAV